MSQMELLYKQRRPVTTSQLDLATTGWSAFRSSNAIDLQSFMGGNLTPLPFLHAALSRYLEEYPWFQDGLTRTERQTLTLASKGISSPVEIFKKNMELETALFIGDWGTFSCIAELCAGEQPLLHCDTSEKFWFPPQIQNSRDAFKNQRLRPTEIGNAGS